MNEFQVLLGKTVKRLFIIVWPPYGEEKLSDVDISIGFVFNESPDQLCILSTDETDLCPLGICFEPLPTNIFAWSLFATRIESWMNCSEGDFIHEYYEVTSVDTFENIVSHIIQSVELVTVRDKVGLWEFGVKVTFENDYILSMPIADGSTVETSRFNRNNNLSIFEKIGVIEYILVKF